jgi:hypothetical protein
VDVYSWALVVMVLWLDSDQGLGAPLQRLTVASVSEVLEEVRESNQPSDAEPINM